MSLQPNPLNQFRLYNYRLSLSAVTKEEYNSGNYLDSERLVIARSGGTPAGSGNIQTYTEEQLGINVEYFIDDLNIEGLVIPNGGTGTSEATQMSFTISEPYSIPFKLFVPILACVTLWLIANVTIGFRNIAPAFFKCI